MRGYPLLRLLILAGVLLVLGIPVWSITRKTQPPASVTPVPREEKVAQFDVTLTSSAPAKLSLSAGGGKPILTSYDATGLKHSYSMNEKKPDDLVVTGVAMNRGLPLAVRVVVESNGRNLLDTTLWGSGSVEDALSIPAP